MMSNTFWSLVLLPGKKYSSTVSESFHISTAVVDTKSINISKNDNNVHPVQVQIGDQDLVLCNLSNQLLQMNLDLMFSKGTELTFFTTGKATVHLTGYTIPDDYSDSSTLSSSDDNEVDWSDREVLGHARKKPKQASLKSSKKEDKQTARKGSPEKRRMDSDPIIAPKKYKLAADAESSGDEDTYDLDKIDDSDLGDFSFSDDGNEVDEEEGNDEGSDATDDEDELNESDITEDSDSHEESDSGAQSATKKNVVTSLKANQKTPISGTKQNKTPVSIKKQDNKLEKSTTQQLTNGITPKSNKKNKKKNTSKEAQTPTNNESTPQTPKIPKKQTLEGGVIVEDLKLGNGPVAKPGKMVAVYYTGRLKNNNRVFDQANSGPGFKFRLGRGEVIKSWDIALNGMKVGSKRRVTCPPTMAYGSKGSPPSIPPNSSLVFDIELKSVN